MNPLQTLFSRLYKRILVSRRRSLGRSLFRECLVPTIEILEGRVAPAGIVTTSIANGVLTITGADDLAVNANNNQQITLTGSAPGSFTLTANGGETFAGAGAGPFAGV